MQMRFKTSFKRVLKGGLLVEVFFLLTDARGNENITHPVFSSMYEMVWSKVMSREKTIITEHERRKDTKASVIVMAV